MLRYFNLGYDYTGSSNKQQLLPNKATANTQRDWLRQSRDGVQLG